MCACRLSWLRLLIDGAQFLMRTYDLVMRGLGTYGYLLNLCGIRAFNVTFEYK